MYRDIYLEAGSYEVQLRYRTPNGHWTTVHVAGGDFHGWYEWECEMNPGAGTYSMICSFRDSANLIKIYNSGGFEIPVSGEYIWGGRIDK